MEKILLKIQEFLDYIGCLVKTGKYSGFGSLQSSGKPYITQDKYILVLAVVDKPCLLTFRNWGANDIEISAKGDGEGFPVKAGEIGSLDRFRGNLYVRSLVPGSSSTFWYYLWMLNE